MSVVSIIQARMSSSRLPGKVLMPLGGRSVLAQVVRRSAIFSQQVIVCTSVDSSDDPIEQECIKIDVPCVRGSLDDVFSRYRLALSDSVVQPTTFFARITADCPLVSPTLAAYSLNLATDSVDYVGIEPEMVALGLSIEVVRRTAFESLDSDSLDGPQKEHVTLAIYENPDRFQCVFAQPPPALSAPQFRLTLDYEEDYQLLMTLFERDSDVTAEQAIHWMKQDEELAAINASCRQKAAR